MGSRIPRHNVYASTPSPLPRQLTSDGGSKETPPSAVRNSASGLYGPALARRGDGEGEKVKVFARIRPALREDETPGALAWSEEAGQLTIFRPDAPVPESNFHFEKVLGPTCSQADVYSCAVSDVVADVVRGYNGTILAYGQTGAGKTYTLGNTAPDAIGMIPRAAAELFAAAGRDPSHTYRITMSYIQIYMEMIQDLLNPTADNLPIREDANGNGVFVAGACEVPVASLEECLHYLELGEQNRVFAFTHLNAHSSRSHAVVMLTAVKARKYLTTEERAQAEAPDQDGVVTQRVTVGKLYLVDLAGSERLKKSKSVGLRATEARSINLSLTMLGMCISARAQDSPHVPFRDSKLTRLLQESLGGNAKTSLILCLSDVRQHADESLQSLQFGSRAACVRNKPVVNERLAVRQLTAELLAALEEGHERADGLEAALTQTKEERDALQAALAREKARSAAIVDALRVEAESKHAQAAAKLAEQATLLSEHVQQLDQVQQQQGQLEQEVARLRSEQQAADEAHKAEVAALQQRVAAAAEAAELAAAERARSEEEAKRQHAALAAAAQRHAAALTARLAAERAAAREQASAIHLALARLQQALGALAGGPAAANSGPLPSPRAMATAMAGPSAAGSAPEADSGAPAEGGAAGEGPQGSGGANGGPRAEWVASLAAAAAAAASRRGSGSGAAASGASSTSAVQLMQEALGLTAPPAEPSESAAAATSALDGTASGASSNLGPGDTESNTAATEAAPGTWTGQGTPTSGRPTVSGDDGFGPGRAPLPAATGAALSPDGEAPHDGGAVQGSDLDLDAALAAARDDLLAELGPVQRVPPGSGVGRLRAVATPPPAVVGPVGFNSAGVTPTSQAAAAVAVAPPPPPRSVPPAVGMSRVYPVIPAASTTLGAGAVGSGGGGYAATHAAATAVAAAMGGPFFSPSRPHGPMGYGQLYGTAARVSGHGLPGAAATAGSEGSFADSAPSTSAANTPARPTTEGAAAEHPDGVSGAGSVFASHGSASRAAAAIAAADGAASPSLSSALDDSASASVGAEQSSYNRAPPLPYAHLISHNPAFDTADSDGVMTDDQLPDAAGGAAAAGARGLSTGSSIGGGAARAGANGGAAVTSGGGAAAPGAPLFSGIQVQLDALMELAAAARRTKAGLEERVAEQEEHLVRLTEAQAAEAEASEQARAQLQDSGAALAAAQASLAETTAQLLAARHTLEETLQALDQTRLELDDRTFALGENQGTLADTASRLEEATARLREAEASLEASETERAALRAEVTKLQADLAQERSALRGVLAATERSTEQSVAARAERHELQRQVGAANTIKRAYKRFKVVQLRRQVETKQQALAEAEAAQAERSAQAATRQAVQSAVAGQALVQESVAVMRDAVESILAAFVGRRKELDARRSLNDRMAKILPPPPPAAPGAAARAAGPLTRAFQSARTATGGGGAAAAAGRTPLQGRHRSLSLMLAAATAPSPSPGRGSGGGAAVSAGGAMVTPAPNIPSRLGGSAGGAARLEPVPMAPL
ncbi:hypothetical protein HYH03_016243 [Edaphochlamys debaryana]|uniref:Kinesin motor domain-containing protein n=1 Tax=Edaphochlamys debaryana TaxID=47281 RepID=A0A835XKG4_9CHLO|nr:hypothetical protein HYH03_016243 [Edaphochlamys debaryana]|eukprot:KAG2485040.1 hypothetical protein HYH03_016243 [Edaphochlamys debaryana]